MREVILNAVAQHSGARPADDDRTVMIVQFESLSTFVQLEAAEAVAV